MRARLNKLVHKWNDTLSIQKLSNWTEQSLMMPFYHTIAGDESIPHIQHLYKPRSIKLFEEDLDFYCKHYKPIELSELVDAIDNEKTLPQNAFFLTFDDGLKEVYTIIAPILKRKGIPATIFLNSDFIDNQALFFRYKASLIIEQLTKETINESLIKRLNDLLPNYNFKHSNLSSILLNISYQKRNDIDVIAKELNYNFSDYLQNEQPYLTTEQIKTLQSDGFTFGAHSMDHPMYKNISPEDQLNQTVTSVNLVQQNFNTKYKSFAFPFTDDGVSQAFFKNIQSQQHLDISFACAGLKEQSFPFHFQRIPIEESNASAEVQIKTELVYFLMKKLIGKNKVQYAK